MKRSLVLTACMLVWPAAAQYATCPEQYGLQVYPHDQYCDKFYKCANGKLTKDALNPATVTALR